MEEISWTDHVEMKKYCISQGGKENPIYIDAIKKNATITLNTIPKDSFKKCFQQWQDRWKQCASSQGEYFKNY